MIASALPDKQRVIDYVLSLPVVPEGQRHKLGILPCMIQLASNGIGLEESIDVVSRAYPIGSGKRKITRKELEDAWTSAKAKDYKPWVETFSGPLKYDRPQRSGQQQDTGPKFKPFVSTGRRESFTGIDITPADFIGRMFDDGEWVCLGKKDENGQLSNRRETFIKARSIGKLSPEKFTDEQGVYFISNPLKDWESRKDENIAAYRRLLVELEVPKDKRDGMTDDDIRAANEMFVAAIKDTGLPCDAVYTSGGPSVHAQVRIDAKSLEEFKEWQNLIYEFCKQIPGFDGQNGNPARYSRLPGAYHGEHLQQLICWKTGAENIQKWKESVEPRLFEIENPLDWSEKDMELPPVLIDGWNHKGHLGMLTGSMKTNKSWTLLELAICFAQELKWFGRQCKESTVLYIDAEIQRPFWRQRAGALCRQRELVYEEVMKTGRIRPAFVAGKNITATALRLELERLFERGELNDVDAIVIDPIYQFYDESWDENGNSDMAKLGRILRAIAELTGVSILFAHHHTKGNQDGKRDIEKASGGGAFGRFVASSLAITLIDEESRKYTLGWTTTNFAPAPKQVAYREEFEWRITDEDPKEAARNHRTVDDIMGCLPDAGLSSEHWLAACREQFEITDDAFETLRPKAKKEGRCFYSKSSDRWEPTAAEIEMRGSGLPISDDDEQ